MKKSKLNIDMELQRLREIPCISANDSFADDILNEIGKRRKKSSRTGIEITYVFLLLIINFAFFYKIISLPDNKAETRNERIAAVVEVFSLNN